MKYSTPCALGKTKHSTVILYGFMESMNTLVGSYSGFCVTTVEANPGRVSNGATGMSVEALVHTARCVLLEGGLSRSLHLPGFPTQTITQMKSIPRYRDLQCCIAVAQSCMQILSDYLFVVRQFGMDSLDMRLTL